MATLGRSEVRLSISALTAGGDTLTCGVAAAQWCASEQLAPWPVLLCSCCSSNRILFACRADNAPTALLPVALVPRQAHVQAGTSPAVLAGSMGRCRRIVPHAAASTARGNGLRDAAQLGSSLLEEKEERRGVKKKKNKLPPSFLLLVFFFLTYKKKKKEAKKKKR